MAQSDEPAAEHQITMLHAWVVVYPSGGEGLLSYDMALPGLGVRHMPLMSSHRAVAEGFTELAHRIETASRLDGLAVSVELRSYRLITH